MGLTATGAVYGITTYGTEYYGASPTLPATFRWGVEVDWDGDGLFDGSNEADRFLQIQCSRGRKNFLQPNGQGFYPLSVGTCHITLDNSDGRYDAWNTTSPLYPNVTYGKDVRVRVVDVATNTTYPFFYGVISDVVPSGYGANAIVKITAEDGLRYLRNIYLSNGSNFIARTIYSIYAGSTGGSNMLYGAAKWFTRWGDNIDTNGTEVIPIASAPIDTYAIDSLTGLAESYLGYFFVGANGNACYTDRKTIPESPVNYDHAELLKDLTILQPQVNYRNRVTIYWSTYSSTDIYTTKYPSASTDFDAVSAPRDFIYTSNYIQSTATADSISGKVAALMSALNKTPIIKLVNRPDKQFPELFNYVTVNVPSLGIDTEGFRVGGIEHYGTPQKINTTLYLEPVFSTST